MRQGRLAALRQPSYLDTATALNLSDGPAVDGLNGLADHHPPKPIAAVSQRGSLPRPRGLRHKQQKTDTHLLEVTWRMQGESTDHVAVR